LTRSDFRDLFDISIVFLALSFGKGDHFSSGYVNTVNPNSKIPALLDKQGPNDSTVLLFESGSILLYLAEKYQRFLPEDPLQRIECKNWLFWGAAGFGPTCGVFGHYMIHAPADALVPRGYGIGRYGMEVQRHLSVLENQLKDNRTDFVVGNELTIADFISFPWANALINGFKHGSGMTANELLHVKDLYPNVVTWVERIAARPAIQRGLTVCSFNGQGKPWLEHK
jgi:GST-like protein